MKVFLISGIILLMFWGLLSFTVKQAERIGSQIEKNYTANLFINLK